MSGVLPNSYHGSVTFNSKVKTYDHLAQRIKRSLGAPLIEIELSGEQIYEMIDIALEYFTKFAGITEEYLIFRSDLYIPKVGLPIARMFSTSPDMYNPINPDDTTSVGLSACFDYDLGDFRRVVDVFSFDQGNNSGVNTLFTIENTVAQQAYFGHLLGNVGYDLITWQTLKMWLDTREKTLGLMPYVRFDPDNQILKIIPEPTFGNTYFGLLGCKVQKPIKDLISQLWVYKYSLALCKIALGHVRNKYKGTNLFGGQTVNGDEVMAQGTKEKDELEKELVTDRIDTVPTKFFLG